MSSLPTPEKGLSLWANPLDSLAGRAFLGRRIDQCFRTLETWGDGVDTGCSESPCKAVSSLSSMPSERLVGEQHMDSCVPWVDLGLSWMGLEGRVD